MSISSTRAGAALGGVAGIIHLGWATLVFLGWARPILEFVLWMHFINLPVTLDPFDVGRAAVLVVVTTILGFIAGSLAAGLWNHLQLDGSVIGVDETIAH